MNKVILMGRLTRDPEVRYSQSSEPMAIAKYTLAVDRRGSKNPNEPTADFINCVAFKHRAEFAEKYFKKGMLVAITGSLRINSWDDQNGVKRWFTDVMIDDQFFAESKASFESRHNNNDHDTNNATPSNGNNSQPNENSSPDGFYPFSGETDIENDEDLPF